MGKMRLELLANKYPDASLMENLGIEIISGEGDWKVFVFPKNWRTKHASKGVENIIAPTGEIVGRYRVSYLLNMEEREIKII